MRRTLLIFLMLSLAIMSLSFATVTRTKTMGRVGHWVQDDSNIFPWPSTVVRFSDRFILELGEGTFTGGYNPVLVGSTFPTGFGGGALFALNDTHHLGFYAAANDRANGGGTVDPFFPTGLNIDDFLTLFYGYGGRGDTDFGLNFNLGSSRNEQTAPENAISKQSVGRVGIQGGVTHRLEEDKSIEVAFGFQTTSITDEGVDSTGSPVTISEDEGFKGLLARARMFWNYTDEIQFVPFLEYVRANRGVRRDSDGDGVNEDDKEERTEVNVALGINYVPVEKVRLIAVCGILLMKSVNIAQGQDAGESRLQHLPYVKGGVEAGVRDWFDIRAGVEKQLVRTKAIPTTTWEETTSGRFQGYIGAGFYIAGWTIDMQVNPNIFYNGPNFISGVSETMNHRVSLVRPW